MKQESKHVVGKCFGSTVVGPRGQMVVPAEARKDLGINMGTKLLAFGQFHGKGLVLVKTEDVEELLNTMSHHLDEFSRLLRENKEADIDDEGN
ncbi:MAG: AbrB/MazE/SpoVT family DNA-binding domain-containing protein [Dehalococcoidia bacterium]|nr:AbrB/MazE/SpoVT family DNA-binding domain-containing protein [Dehalococcoidia bacterium]